MLFALTLALSCLFLPAACQFDDSGLENGFHPDPLTTGLFAILCIFALVYGGLLVWTVVALFTSRGHRSPYALLLPALVFFAWSNTAYIALIILENIPSLGVFANTLPDLLLPTLGFVLNLLNDWAIILQFLVVIAVLWNRESALRVASEGKFGGHHPALIAVHATLAVLMFVFGTASEALNMDTNVKFYTTDYFFGNTDALDHRIAVRNQLFYTFTSFAILSAVDVAVTTVLLWRAGRKAALPDKIVNLMLYAVVPLYSILSLLLMIFTIIFSSSGLPSTASVTTFEGANLASSLLPTLFSFAVIVVILVLSIRSADWSPGGWSSSFTEPPKQQYWAPQPQYMYTAPQSQAGYHAAGPPQQMPYGQPQPMAYGPPQGAYLESHLGSSSTPQQMQYESAPGEYTAPSSTQGSYIPPHSNPLPEKTGFHVA
ncbi:hypothetical protein C8F04DRAFT_1265690 [Mycena alexandri]|uniref:Uncharacterized protein n=1 Tax=Mycena alexandri TaxID=1745969 RepID=A0AAD6WVE0_9AGAR|nr:hypothetical protein C8F04DRAFT_1265690 [Mycena alexandri]